MDTNVVVIQGRLTKAPTFKRAGETAVLEFSLACGRWVKGEERTSFFDCVLFGKRAETLATHLDKGSPVIVSGALEQQRWQAQDGSNRSRVHIIANDVSFAGPKQERQSKPTIQQQFEEVEQDGFTDDIPF